MRLENEIRIGNYLLDIRNNDVHKVSGNTIHSLQYDNSRILKPIPLTEEWLLRFGYKPYQGHFIITGHLVWKCNNLLMCEKNGIIIKSAHQLQNLYFALTNKELVLQE